jgi:hypothetical protein
MFRRLFWFLTGAATGAWATVKVNRALRRLKPDGLAATAADRALETGARMRAFAADVRAGMAQREGELQDALGLTGADPRPPAPRALDTDLPAPRRGIAYRTHDRKDEH